METFFALWPFVRGIHRLPMDSPHKGQWRGTSMFLWFALNKRPSKDSRRRWFRLWRHCNVYGSPLYHEATLRQHRPQWNTTKHEQRPHSCDSLWTSNDNNTSRIKYLNTLTNQMWCNVLTLYGFPHRNTLDLWQTHIPKGPINTHCQEQGGKLAALSGIHWPPVVPHTKGQCSETTANNHASTYFRYSLGAPVISTNIRTVGFCVKTAIIPQWKCMCPRLHKFSQTLLLSQWWRLMEDTLNKFYKGKPMDAYCATCDDSMHGKYSSNLIYKRRAAKLFATGHNPMNKTFVMDAKRLKICQRCRHLRVKCVDAPYLYLTHRSSVDIWNEFNGAAEVVPNWPPEEPLQKKMDQ